MARDSELARIKDAEGWEAAYCRAYADMDALRDTLMDILDVVVGWTRPMTDAEKLAVVREIAEQALEASA